MTNTPETPAQDVIVVTSDQVPLIHRAADVLTEAVLEYEDAAGFFAVVLASVAANLGSVDRVTAGRPGSWEADLVQRLLRGTVGEEVDLRYRTRPVVVTLNVADLVADAAFIYGPNFAVPDLDDALTEALDESGLDPNMSDEDFYAWQAARETDVLARYRRGYEAYAERFTALVRACAAELLGEEPFCEIRVEIETDPRGGDGSIRNPERPGGLVDDQLVLDLWTYALERAGAPEVES